MSDKGEGCSLLIMAGAAFGFFYFISMPSGDQVCRTSKLPVFDTLHGIEYQPTCQALISQTERRAIAAERKAADLSERNDDLESRLLAIEMRLNM